MTTTTNQFRVIRSLAIVLVLVSGLFGVAFVGAQENPETLVPAETTVDVLTAEEGGLADKAAAADCGLQSARNNLTVSDVVINPMTGKAVSNVTNNSMTCTYNVALSSYETGIYVQGQEQEYIDRQELFANTVRSVAPGQQVHLAVDVPSCNWQADVYWYANGEDEAPVPPDFAPLQDAGTHWLFDAEHEFESGSCFPEDLIVSCAGAPLNPETNETVTWTASVSGGSGQYTYSWVGNGSFPDGPGGDDSAPATTNPVTASYHAVGTKNANVTVTSPGHSSVTARCSVEVVEAEQTCQSTAAANLVSADGTPFDPYDGPNNEDIVVINGVASVVVKNISDTCEYNVGLTSYKTGEYTPGQEQEFINGQQFYDEDIRQGLLSHIGPGQTATLRVDVPQCNYQIDLYAFVDGAPTSPVPPDFKLLTDTHTLLDWEVDATLGSCFVTECPVAPPVITTTGTASGTVGAPFSHDITITGASVAPITTGTLPAGLTLTQVNATLWRISGTPTQTGTTQFGISVTNQCGTDSASITITIGGSCPINPPAITSPTTASGAVGSPFSYTITTTGTVSSLTVTNLPAGLTFSGNTISGTPTQTGTFTAVVTAANQCGTTTINLVITISGVCPFNPPVFVQENDEVRGTVGVSMSYTLRVVQEVGTLTYDIASGVLPPGLSLSGNVISGMPTQAADATVIVRVSNQCGSDTMTLRIIIAGQCVPPTITSSGNREGTVGEPFSYSVSVTGGTPPVVISIEGTLPPGLSFSQSNDTISGTPTQAGTFDVLIRAQAGSGGAICSATLPLRIIIDDDECEGSCGGGGGGGGGGGSRRRPNVVLFAEPEVLGTSISLAQIPYTGLGTSIVQLILFILGLVAISAGIIYAIMRRVRIAPASAVTVTAGPARTTVSVTDESIDEPALAAYEEYAYAAPAPRPAVQLVHTPAQARFEAPVNIPVETPAAEAPRAPMGTLPSVQKNVEMQPAAAVSAARVQNEARASRTLISDDGAELIAHSAEGDEKKALERLNQIVDIAKSRYPREDGWLILDKDRVRETLFISTLSMIPLFVEWIVRGEDKKVFTFLRMLKHQEQPVADFMRKVVSDLDNAYRARMEGSDEGSNVNQHIAEVTYHLSNKELETIVGELLHGVDERYDSAYTSVRLSLVRVLDIIKERSLRAVGSTYAFTDLPRVEAGETAR